MNKGRRPFIGGSDIDSAKLWGANVGHGPETDEPPDATRPKDPQQPVDKKGRKITPDVDAIQTGLITKLSNEFAATDLVPSQDTEFQGVGLDAYVSGFAGYHALWYNEWAKGCKAGWHTHVDYGITTANASKAIKIQLEELIKWLDVN